eukprot:CAMPEP_0179333404 /NCGR_PEP_ID=MMETSP0797-20121207/65294_1 /TAXON_ID=47934 /ORGANISM="Dinophysis acuminata, Strain DAEP01" /LENGTH=30 /DNA_ID= /DNA_START= /DNA_END= /DNA_ORIENTATION=
MTSLNDLTSRSLDLRRWRGWFEILARRAGG